MRGTLPLGRATSSMRRAATFHSPTRDPLYLQNVSPEVRAAMAALVRKLTTGALSLPVPRME